MIAWLTGSKTQSLRDALEAESLAAEVAAMKAQRQLLESAAALYDGFVDPREAFAGDDGSPWNPVALFQGASVEARAYTNEAELALVRNRCRRLLLENEFALSGHENRISYLVGSGHRYAVQVHGIDPERAASLTQRVNEVLARFCRRQKWATRQQEIVRRMDRDGECFLRFFPVAFDEGLLAVRFVEPEEVSQPAFAMSQPETLFGVVTHPRDVETIEGFYVDREFVPAALMQHRKANVDQTARRGLPLFYPVLSNLERTEKLLRNMSVLSQTQAAIAVVRKHAQASATAVANFAQQQATFTTHSQAGGVQRYKRLSPGTILDAPAGIDYQFPAIGVNAANLVGVLQAELRAIAARLVMPEFMLSQDASNGNYASVLVAEGPAAKNFRRLQAALVADDLEVFDHLLERMVDVGWITPAERAIVSIETEPPTVEVRERKAEAETNEILFRNHVKSRETWQLEAGLDPMRERERIAAMPMRPEAAVGSEESA